MIKISVDHVVELFAIWCITLYALFAFVSELSGRSDMLAMLDMVSGLLLLWVVLGGSVMFLLRDKVRMAVQRVHLDWRYKFVLLCTFLALIEEAVTTSMTDLAPMFGVKMGEVYITASPNYIDVVTQHSVVIFVPMFIVWAWLLSRYDVGPGSVFVLFGLTGTLAETITFGPQNILQTGMWVFVYGLMIYLPAYSVPHGRGAVAPKPRHYLLAIFAPIVLMIPMFDLLSVTISLVGIEGT